MCACVQIELYVVVCVLQPFLSWLFSGFAAAMPPKKQRRKEKATAVLEENTEKQEEDSLPDALVKHLKNMTVCTVCRPGDRFSGRSHASRSGHP